jgi:hypothetical protein
MAISMTTLVMSLLTCFVAGSLPPLALLFLQARMHREREREWTRIFCVKSLEIPGISMAGEPEQEEPKVKKPDTRPRLTVPLAVSDYAREVYRAVKRSS